MRLIVICTLFLTLTTNLSSQTITLDHRYAFPSAEGFGQNTTGGRGGQVIYVTNTNNSGSGSLREALTTSGARVILFKVSGTISISSPIYVTSGDVTIDGASSPGQGIQIIGTGNGYIEFNQSNIIIRNIRFRGNGSTAQSSLRFVTSSGKDLNNLVVDHCSFAWPNPGEMAISFGVSTGNYQWSNVTISNCIFGEMNRGILQYKGHSNISYYRNYFYGIYQRSPTVNYPELQPVNSLGFEVINQIWHNMFHFPVEATWGFRISVIGSKRRGVSGTANPSGSQMIEINNNSGEGLIENTYLYQNNNINEIGNIYDSETGSFIKPTPYLSSNIIGNLILPTVNIDNMLPTIGAFYWNRDSHDQRFINYYLNNNGSQGTYSGTPDALTGGTPYLDSNNDGIDDGWATTHGITSASQVKASYTIGGKTIINDAGYYALEIFLADLAKDFERLPLDSPSGVPVITLLGSNPMHLQVGQSYNEPGATATNTSDPVVITGTVNTSEAGTYYRYYNVSNEVGPADQLIREVIVSDLPQPGKGKGFNRNILLTLD